MDSIGLFEAKTRLSEICAEVSASGTGVTITKRGKPIVRIEPIEEKFMTIRERRAAYFIKHEPGGPPINEPDFEIPPRDQEERRTFKLDD